MHAAEYRKANVLLTFGHSVRKGRARLKLPTRAQYRAQIKAVRKRYPFVKTFQAWNEANHGSQPTAKKPGATGKLYDVLVKTCRGCKITAPSILIAGTKELNWLKAFDKGAKKRVKIWAIHNHIDANRNTTTGTKQFLKTFKRGKVWFTETGGIWNRWVPKKTGKKKHIKRYNSKCAVRADAAHLQAAAAEQAPDRADLLSTTGTRTGLKKPQWDSGLIGATARSARRSARSRPRCGSTLDEPQRHGQQRGRGAVAQLDLQQRIVER